VIETITKTNNKLVADAMEQLNKSAVSGTKKDDFQFTSQRAKDVADLMLNMRDENFDWDEY